MWISPPLSTAETEIEEMIQRLDRPLDDWEGALDMGAA
jgi:hypothetical protein